MKRGVEIKVIRFLKVKKIWWMIWYGGCKVGWLVHSGFTDYCKIVSSLVILDNFRVSDNNALLKSICYYIALPLDSLLLRGVAARPCFCLQAQHRKHARRHAHPRDGLKAGLGLMPRSNRLSNGRAMPGIPLVLGGFHLHLLVFPFAYQFNSRIGVLVKSSFAND